MSTHQRDGSLLRRKQDQWARERAEEAESGWFPFGSPGGGNPNRKYESIDYSTPPAKTQPQQEPSSQETSANYEKKEATSCKPSSQHPQSHNGKMMAEVSSQYHGVQDFRGPHSAPAGQVQSAYPFPFQYTYQMPPGYHNTMGPTQMQWSYMQPIPINFIPPGTIPIPVQDLSRSIAEGTPICPATVAEQFAQMNGQNANWGTMAQAVPVAIPIPPPASYHAAPVDPSQEPHETNVAVVPPMGAYEGNMASPCCSGVASRRNTSESTGRERSSSSATDYGEQIAERKRTEEGCVERDHLADEKAEREQDQDNRKHEGEERKQKEEELSKEQEMERRRKAMEEALERAKHEAEITRKARVFKHVLEGAEKSPELERRLLGVDPETGDRILQEITQMERQKKLEREALDRRPPTRRADEQRENSPADKRSRSAQPKPRTSSISESYATIEIRDDRAKSPPGRKQTASIRPFNSADDRVIRSAYEPPVNRIPPPPPAVQSTPMRRSVPGRMSVRVTRKEKENTAVEDGFSRGPTRATMRSSNSPAAPLHRDQRMPQSKIPIATPLPNAAKSACRPSTLPPQPLRNANHFPAVETEAAVAAHANRSFPGDIPRPRTLAPCEDYCDNPLFSPVATRHRRLHRMRGLTDSPVNVDSAGSSGGSTEENHDGNTSSGSASPQTTAQSPVPAIVIGHDAFHATKSVLTSNNNNNELKIRSALSSPASYLSQTPRNSSFVKKMAEKGCIKHAEDALALDVRRKAEANLSRTSSVQSLRGSMGNLAGWRGSISNLAEDSVNLSRFKSHNPIYRSFNAKKNTDKQREVIDRLSKLRESLRSREGFVERGVLPKHQITSPSAAVKI